MGGCSAVLPPCVAASVSKATRTTTTTSRKSPRPVAACRSTQRHECGRAVCRFIYLSSAAPTRPPMPCKCAISGILDASVCPFFRACSRAACDAIRCGCCGCRGVNYYIAPARNVWCCPYKMGPGSWTIACARRFRSDQHEPRFCHIITNLLSRT